MAVSAPTNARMRMRLGSACTLLMVLSLASCATNGKTDRMTTGSVPTASLSKPIESMNAAELAAAERSAALAYDRAPKDRNVGLNYANILRMNGKNAQALAVMQQVAIAYPNDREVLSAYGKAQAAAGQLEQALATISRAQTPDRPDWRLYSAEGAVLDQLGARKRRVTATEWRWKPSRTSQACCPISACPMCCQAICGMRRLT